jgi:hypothetical protein
LSKAVDQRNSSMTIDEAKSLKAGDKLEMVSARGVYTRVEVVAIQAEGFEARFTEGPDRPASRPVLLHFDDDLTVPELKKVPEWTSTWSR